MNAKETSVAGGHGAVVSAQGDSDIRSIDVNAALQQFRDKGLVLFRGFKTDMDGFRWLTGALSGGFMTYEGGASARTFVDGDPTLLTVSEAKHSFAVPLHGEMYYQKIHPAILWFYCANPAAVDGETTVASGVDVYNALSPATRELFESRKVNYICTYPDGRWQELFQTDNLDKIKALCRANDMTVAFDDGDRTLVTTYAAKAVIRTNYTDEPAFINNVFAMTRWESLGVQHRVVRLEDGSPLPEAVVAELRRVEEQTTLPVAWQPGDVLMVDNSRFLHGRRAFDDKRREIYVRLASRIAA